MVMKNFSDWPISIHNWVYIFIVFFRTLLLTFYTLRSVRRKCFMEYVVKCLLFFKAFFKFCTAKKCLSTCSNTVLTQTDFDPYQFLLILTLKKLDQRWIYTCSDLYQCKPGPRQKWAWCLQRATGLSFPLGIC